MYFFITLHESRKRVKLVQQEISARGALEGEV